MPYAEGDGMTGSGTRLRVLVATALVAATIPAAAQQLDSAFLGSWASEAKECSAETSDARFEITQTGMSGPEFFCTTIAAVPQGDGWAMRLACAAEGEEYTADSHWQLLPNGNLRQSANGVVTEYLPCRKGAVAAASGDGGTTGSGLETADPKGAETIRYVQRRLSQMGFDPGGADGRFGARTARALRAFEASRGLPETGEVNRVNLAALDGSGGGAGQSAGALRFDPEAIHAAIRTIIESYPPSSEAYDYQEEATRGALARLLKAPPFGGIDVAGFETEAMQSNYSDDPYGLISNPSAFTPPRRFFVSRQHKVLVDEFKAARLAAQTGISAQQAGEFDERFKALLAQTRQRFGAAHPAVGFVLADYIGLRSDMIARLDLVNAELAARHRDAATAMFAGWSSTPSGRLVADHVVANIVSSVAKSLDWREGCAAQRDTAYAAYLEAAAIDHAASGASLRQIGWLLGAARCAENAEQAGTIMRARVQLARMTGRPEAQAQTLAELGAAQFSSGDRAGAASAYREAFRLAVAHGLAPSYEAGFLADWEVFAEKRTAPAHWQVLKELGLDAELDLYIAHVLRRQIADSGFESTYGASLVSSFVDVLEGSGRTALADQYYTYIGHSRRRDGMKGSVSPFAMMTMFTAQRIDSERYDAVLPMLERGLKLAEATGDRHFTVVLLAQLARAHTERGALDEGLNHARRGLVMIKQGGFDMTAYDVKKAVADLDTIVTSAEREQSRLDNAVGGLAVEIQGKLDAACEGTDKLWAFPALPANLVLSNPVIAQALLQHPVVARYIDCFDRGREAFSGPGVEPGDQSAGDRISDVVLLLTLLGEKERVAALFEFFHAKGEKSLGAEAALLRGLVVAGKGDWFLPYATRSADLAMTTLSAAKQNDLFPQPAAHIGLDLLAIGERDLSEGLYRRIKQDWEQSIAARGWGCMLHECQYLAVMAEAFDAGKGADDYFARVPHSFTSFHSGAQADTSEADAIREAALDEGYMQLRAGRYRLAEIYFQLASKIVSGYGSKAKGVVASEGDVDTATAMSRIKYERGEQAAARTITVPIVVEARKRFGGRRAYSTEAIVRWSHRLRGLFEVHFDSLDASQAGEIAANEDDFFAFQYLQTTRTAATVAKIAERTSAGSGEAVRRHQDLSRALGELYSAFAVANGDSAGALLERIATKEKEMAAAQQEAEASDPAYAKRPGFRFLTVAETQARLSQGEAVLLSFIGQHHAYLWLVTRTTSSLRRLAILPAALDEEVRALRSAATGYNAGVENRRWPLEPFRKPYRSTLGVFGDDLDGIDRLYFVPHGLFDGLPLAALLAGDPPAESMTFQEMRTAKLPWMIRRTAINMLPSLQAIEQFSRASGAGEERRPFLGIGNPDFGAGLKVASLRGLSAVKPLAIPMLPETETEITRIAEIVRAEPAEDLLVGERANEVVIRQMALDRYRIVTFATHGILAGEFRGVSEPALVLAMPTNPRPDNDGLLTASEVSALRLNAELVMLSACNTAGSDGRPGAEGLSGLANAFFYAGAQNLVVTHWAIPSNPAVDISVGMIEAHQGAQQTDWAKALQASVLKMMDGDGPVAYVHPGAWGAHMVVGAEAAAGNE
jgi:CHAT domain-containing protein/peptidoglycan hydrolase-like protein with peptidoglycan-binding domain